MNYHERLGAAIRESRKRASLTQKELADFAGCGLTFINQLERGKPNVHLAKLFNVLEVLGLTLVLERSPGTFKVSGGAIGGD